VLLKGAEVFSFVAITPRALARDHGARWGRGYLILENVSWSNVKSALQNLLSHCSAENWDGVAAQLSREMHWEFEDYRE
jgi:phenylalanyl-tRNA synthetase beta subunit